MARDRKRAKQRRDRARARTIGQGSPSSAQTRADVPGALDHASADVDEFDAALVKGAGGVPAGNELAEEAFGGSGKDDDRVEEAGSAGNGGGAGGGALSPPVEPSGAPQRGRKSAIGFLRACWAELQRVQWPDRRQVTQATAVVIGFVAIAGAYLGLADYVAKEIVEFIL